MKVLVTGANGFVGTHAVRELLGHDHQVVGATPDGEAIPGATAVRMDVRDPHVILRVLEKERPDALLHLAGIAFVPDARKNPQMAFETNATGTLNVLHAVAEATPDARVIAISSAEVYGKVQLDPGEVLDEDRASRPVTVYGASKAAAEHVARAYAAEGVDVVVLRPFNHVGPGQSERFAVASFTKQVAELERAGGGVLRHGNLEAVRDFLDVRDIVRAYRLALEAPVGRLRAGEPFNVCSGSGTTVARLVEILVGNARCAITTEEDPERLRPVDVKTFVGDPRRFRERLDFEPEYDLDTTLRDALEEARARV